ncbi:uncharacterized protein HMPREF1541_11100 [Cyphellophora europaea CBS 101466]|uniref:Uncharacterized protein n=1 Tax=Cyphellophora europaea (strain CBS 101466) TaxID=1220924 RepID=W2S508_CYPE1|nr:uncharacterized protein HMPREF1541_11100 [Cyphellophora europaea CBS 101466]ETN43776.1 hypothetical protein HMPREF1541_11100 [Cyphellophora europaea CBS 101466]
MASAYLRGFNKAELQELGNEVSLPEATKLKVVELRESLENYLKTNQTTLATRPGNSTNLAGYFEKLGSSARSPAKRQSAAEKVQDAVTSGDEAPKKGRRKTVAPVEQSVERIRDSAFLSNTSNRSTSSVTDLVKTPAKELSDAVAPRRSSILASPGNLDTSPRAIVDYVDRNSRKVSGYISNGISRSHVPEYSEYARDLLSSPLAVNGLALTVESYALFWSLVELRHAFGIPVPYFGKIIPVKAPDVFAFITPEFWAPFSLFFLTTVLLPTVISYFINYPLKSATSHSHSTRRATAQQEAAPAIDPLVFNIAKGLISYLVYAASAQTGLWPYSRNTIQNVNAGLYFGYGGLITSSVIGGTVALYEAVLRK